MSEVEERPEGRSPLARHIETYLQDLARAGNSVHTITAYSSDLAEFLEFLSPPETEPPLPEAIEVLTLREWLLWLYNRPNSAVTIRRKLAAIRGLFKFLSREGVVKVNVAKLVRTPKAPKKLPEVMTAEQVGTLIDGVASNQMERPHPARDRAIFELLYGCGVRVSELAGLNLQDLDRSEGWLRVRGKGRKERQVPMPGKAAESLDRYLTERSVVLDEPAVFLNHHGRRITPRGIAFIVKLYAPTSMATPRCTRTAFAMRTPRTFWPTAPTFAPFRNCWATLVFPLPRSTRRFPSPT